jgi:hypothetical protein
MDRLNGMASTVCARLVDFTEWLGGCGHHKTTFPMTLRAGVCADAKLNSPSDTYIVCLQCGRQFPYDWRTMQITKRRTS